MFKKGDKVIITQCCSYKKDCNCTFPKVGKYNGNGYADLMYKVYFKDNIHNNHIFHKIVPYNELTKALYYEI